MRKVVLILGFLILGGCGSDSNNATTNEWSQSGKNDFLAGCILSVASSFPSTTSSQSDTFCQCMLTYVTSRWSEDYFFSMPAAPADSQTSTTRDSCRSTAGF
jgi:hypothetical protein